MRNRGGDKHNLVLMHESFIHHEKKDEHTCLVFETLGKSLFDFIKSNRYYGFGLKQIQSIAKQVLVGVKFMHEKMKLTHTDLKPENILLKLDTKKQVTERHLWPIQVQRKKQIYDNEHIDEISESENERSHFSDGQNFENEREDGCTGGNAGNFDSKDIEISPEQVKMRRNRFREAIWMRPLDDQVKIIDFGGATY